MIGKTIKYMRKTKKLKQDELSKMLSIKNNTLSGYETEARQPTFSTIEKIANICGYKIYFDNGKEKFEANDLIRKDL